MNVPWPCWEEGRRRLLDIPIEISLMDQCCVCPCKIYADVFGSLHLSICFYTLLSAKRLRGIKHNHVLVKLKKIITFSDERFQLIVWRL